MKKKVRNALMRLQPGQVAIIEWRSNLPSIRPMGPLSLEVIGQHIKRILWTARGACHALELMKRDVDGRTPSHFGIVRCRDDLREGDNRQHRLCLLDEASFMLLVEDEEREADAQSAAWEETQ